MKRTSWISIRTFILLLCVLLVGVSCRIKDGNEMTVNRYRLLLDGTWRFRVDAENRGVKNKWYLGEHTARWDSIAAPGNWDMQRDYLHADGFTWYLRHFDAEIDTTHSFALLFETISDDAMIWLNGERIGEERNYGRRLYFDITDILRERGNVLALRIRNRWGPEGLIGAVELRAFIDDEELWRSEYYTMAPVESAAWVRDAVIYQVYPRAFSGEGTFEAVQQRLPELREMGVTVLWLMPIHPIGEIGRKGGGGSPYAVRDYYAVNPEYGTLDDFKSLVAEAHVHGMHLIIDLVAHHTARDNPLVDEHPEWYMRDEEGRILAPNPDWTDGADLNYAEPGLRSWMKEMMLFWVRDIGIDGFRCDVAEMVPYDFWVDAIAGLRKVKPVLMLAEGDDPKLHIEAFDLTYAWNTYDALLPVIQGKLPAATLGQLLLRERFNYPRNALRLRFLTNHDKHFYEAPPPLLLGIEPARAAAVFLHMLPGVPMIYNGQEVGNINALSLFEKDGIDWESDTLDERALYTALNELRAAEKSLRRGRLRVIDVQGSDRVVVFTRGIDETRLVCTAVNFSDEMVMVTADLPAILEGETLFSSPSAVIDVGAGRIALEPWGYVIVK
ncbi:MAG: DUF3459 domain-containing protein [Bacteroidetes bacterium]|nr:DUF3459 domain-containing protein [Bacteroidota bacterium]